MPLLSKTVINSNLFQQFPTTDFIPGNTVIFYIGTDTASLVNKFEVYNDAYGKVIKCANTFAEVGITTDGIAGSDPIGYLSEVGEHTGTNQFEIHGGGTAATTLRYGNTAGLHSHTVTGIADKINQTIPTHFNTEVYRCIRKEGTYLPKDCVVFGEFFTEVYFKRYEGVSNTLIYGNFNSVGFEEGSNTINFSLITTANGDHSHQLTGGSKYSINSSVTSYAYTPTSAGSHVHQVDYSWSVFNKSKYLKAWVSIQDDTPIANGMIVAYAGNTSVDLPAKWYLCNGANSTPDLREYYILANGRSETHNTIAYTNNQVICTDVTILTVQANTHNHRSDIKQLAAGSPIFVTHDDFDWQHTHTISNTAVGTTINYEPPSIKLAFIMYKA